MSWEVSSMPSKRSSFNWTLYKKDLSRFWPLWGGVTLAGCLVPLYLLLELMSRGGADALGPNLSQGFQDMLYRAVTLFSPAFAVCYAILCAMAVWGYLCSPRSVGMTHALPADRRCLYLTGTAAGLTMMVIPYAVVGGLTCLIMACFGGFAPLAAAQTIVMVLLLTLLFFGLATVCAMATGNIFAAPVLYALVNFLAPMLSTLLGSLTSQFLMGVDGGGWDLTYLSPILAIYETFTVTGEGSGDSKVYYLDGQWIVALYGLLGAALLVLGYLMYRRRRSESAGDVAAFRLLRPVFRYGLAFLSALTLGRVIYTVLWEAVFQKGLYADVVPMGVSMALAGIVGYYIASMLLEKTARVFRGSWPGALTVCAGAAILCCLVSVDLFGAEAYVPEKEDIAWVELFGGEDISLTRMEWAELTAGEDDALIYQVLYLHQAILDQKDYIHAMDAYWKTDETADGREIRWAYVTLRYHLTDGGEMYRRYVLPMTEADLADSDGFIGQLSALVNNRKMAVNQVELPAGAQVNFVDIYPYYEVRGDETLYLDEDEAQGLSEALLSDAQAGRTIRARTSFEQAALPPLAKLTLTYTVRSTDAFGQPRSRTYDMDVIVYDTMTDTVHYLRDQGVIPTGSLVDWRRETFDDYYG